MARWASSTWSMAAARRRSRASLVLGRERALWRHLPAHEVMFQVFDGADLKVNEAWRCLVLRVFDAIEAHVRVRNEQTEVQVGLFRVPIPTVDERGFREAVLNAFVHRDYARPGAIHVQWGADTIEVSNPGGFVEGVTLDNLLVTHPRAQQRTRRASSASGSSSAPAAGST
nr:hypothetical protein [Deltaproteobacteria bacterium]